VNTLRRVALPGLISLAITLLRLFGERWHWSERWFSTATGGIVPSGMSWLFGITWLALPFGAWFAWQLVRAGERPASAAHALGHAVFGVVLVLALLVFGGLERVPLGFPHYLIVVWAVMAVAAAMQWPTWRALAKTLVVYGLVSRIPVVIIMLLAMRGGWGTHYDYVGRSRPLLLPLWPRFFWLAFFPQLVFWVGFTVLAGSLAGSVVALLAARSAREAAPAGRLA